MIWKKNLLSRLAGGNLFVFGDEDGIGDDVRLQHPLGLASYDGNLLIADTYNHRIKQLDIKNGRVSTLFGSGEEGQVEGKNASFYEPGGIGVAGDKLFVADTNNHAIRVVDLKTKIVSTLKIEGLKPPSLIETQLLSRQTNRLSNCRNCRGFDRCVSSLMSNSPKAFISIPNAPQRFDVVFGDSKIASVEVGERRFKNLPLKVPFKL